MTWILTKPLLQINEKLNVNRSAPSSRTLLLHLEELPPGFVPIAYAFIKHN